MKRTILTAMTAALMATAANAGDANIMKLYSNTKTFWVSNYYANNQQGNNMCAMGTAWKTGAEFWLKFTTDGGLFVHVGKKTWRMKANNVLRTVLSFDDQTFSGQATVTDNPTTAEISFDDDMAAKIITQFADAKKLTIMFPNGTETPWPVLIDKDAVSAFSKCSAALLNAADPGSEAPTEQKPSSSNPPKYRGA